MFRFVSFCIALLVSVNSFSQTADANIRLWLKADAGTNTTTNGGAVTSWTQYAGTVTPTFTGSAVYNNTGTYNSASFFNFNPSLTMSGDYLTIPTPSALVSGMTNANIYYALSITTTTVTTSSSTWGELHNFSGIAATGPIYGPYPGNLSGCVQCYVDEFGATAVITTANISNRVPMMLNAYNNLKLPYVYNSANERTGTTRQAFTFLNGATVYSKSGTSSSDDPVYTASGAGPMTIFKGDGPTGGVNTTPLNCNAAEVLLLGAMLPANERSNVNSYFAIKYGTTLRASTTTSTSAVPVNYTASNSTTTRWANDVQNIWTASAAASYSYNIIGIGKDNLTTHILHQKQSRSVNTNSTVMNNVNNGNLVTISTQALASTNAANTTNIANNNSYLMVSDNGLQVTSVWNDPEKPVGITTRLKREWYTQATNFTQNVSIGFDQSQLISSFPISDLRLLTDDDGDFTNATIESVSAVMNGGFIEFQNVTGIGTSTKKYFTLGNVGNLSVLPIALVDFNANCNEYGHIDLSWSTASEQNNESFTIEYSNDGNSFYDVAMIPGSNNSSSLKKYSFTDMSDNRNDINYYRLRQKDFSGHITYSDIVSLKGCSDKVLDITLFPNPINASNELNWKLSKSINSDVEIVFYDLLGQVCLRKYIEKNSLSGTLNIEGLNKGIYFVKINNAILKLKKTIKLVVE